MVTTVMLRYLSVKDNTICYVAETEAYKRPIHLHCAKRQKSIYFTRLTMQVNGAFINASVSAAQQL